VAKKLLRKILFWTHLVIGLAAGGVIAVVAFTGATMAFEKQVIAWAERDLRHVSPPTPDAPRLPLETIIAQLRTSHPDARPASVIVSSDPTEPLTFSLGRTGSLYVDPYTGEAKPSGAREVRAFFRLMLTWHRWLGVSSPPPGRPESAEGSAPVARTVPAAEGESADADRGERPERGPPGARTGGFNARQFAGSVVGIACIIFLTLCLSGLYLWWPRSWSWRAVKATSLLNPKLRGKARDFNWHNAIGLWSAPLLLVITFTGLVMAYRGFASWVYPRPEGQAAFGPGGPAVTVPTPPPGAVLLGPDALLAAAQKEVPRWDTITLRLAGAQGRGGRGMGGRGGPGRGEARGGEGRGGEARPGGGESRASSGPSPASLSVRESGWPPHTTTLQLDPYTGALLRRSGLSDLSFRLALRSLNRTLHTGEAGGLFGQTLAFLACLGGLFLVYTGFALSFRRFFKRAPRAAPKARPAPAPSPVLVASPTAVAVAAPVASTVSTSS
jgi:uncharacterized iron-regulated membrane protein